MKICTDKLLRERHFGEAQGKNKEWIIEQARNSNKNLREYVPIGGENCAQVLKRWKLFFEKLFAQILEETRDRDVCGEEYAFDVLVVTHGALMKEIFKYLILDLNCHFFHDYDELNKPIGNTSISHFSFEYRIKRELPSQQEQEQQRIWENLDQLFIRCNYLYRNDHLNTQSETLCDL